MAKNKSAKKTTAKQNAASSATSDPQSSKNAVDLEKGAASKTQKPDSHFPIVGIGASAGGLEALDELFDHMPPDTGMSFVVVTHQHPGHTSLLPELLGKHTKMPVAEATDGVKLQPNHVYVAPPSSSLATLNGTLQLMQPAAAKPGKPRLSIDYFFHSLATDRQHQAICIVLSGTGTDGTIGLKAIKAESGMAMVQKPESAKYAGMPSSAMATGLVDYVSPVAELPAQLVAYANGPYLKGGMPPSVKSLPADSMQKIFLLLRNRTGHDFSHYKSSTIQRRIERRMNVHQIDTPNNYVKFIQDNPSETDLLFKELLISVTNFFRDPAAFEALAKQLLLLLKSRPEKYTLRVWVPGCATGEEVYSIAILIHECMEQINRHFDVQIFGTDLDNDAIEAARTGVYPDGIAGDVSSARLERYFNHEDSTYRICKEIREMAVFAPQNVIKDPPFTKLDLISCRNLLIYLDSELQRLLLPIFHYALKADGLLLLGPSESTGQFNDRLETLDKKWKIYRRKDAAAVAYTTPELPTSTTTVNKPLKGNAAMTDPNDPAAKNPKQLSAIIERCLLEELCPASVVANERGDVIYVHGHTGKFLELAKGLAGTNVLDMARKGLEHELASAIRRVAAGAGRADKKNVRVKTNGDHVLVNVSVKKITDPESIRGLLMISFLPIEEKEAVSRATSDDSTTGSKEKPGSIIELTSDGDTNEVDLLKSELQHLRESHQATLEELETSNEELKSTNEELQSTNEEIQSTNEELETSKEEMHSLNEELTTVNSELQSKVEDLSQTNDDMQNLLNSTEIATIFLDRDLNINRFTDQAKSLISVRPSDVGRPINELATHIKTHDLQKYCQDVLKKLTAFEIEVRSTDGKWFMMKIMPYRTSENVIEGVVITFVDISPLMAGREALAFSQSIINTVTQPLVILDEDLHVVAANKSFYKTFKTSEKQSAGELLFELGSAQWDVAELRSRLEQVLSKDKPFELFEIEAEFPKIGRRTFSLSGHQLDRDEGLPGMILLAMEEIT